MQAEIREVLLLISILSVMESGVFERRSSSVMNGS